MQTSRSLAADQSGRVWLAMDNIVRELLMERTMVEGSGLWSPPGAGRGKPRLVGW